MRISDWSSDVCSSDLLAAPALAQKPTGKKIYCWNDGDRKVCGDALPASAVDNARTEFSASGIATKRLDLAPPVPERAAAIGRASVRESGCQLRVVLGGRRLIQTTTTRAQKNTQ